MSSHTEKEGEMTTENWVVVADSVSARIYLQNPKKRHDPFILLHELEHLDSKKRDHDLVSDKPGRYKESATAGHGTFVPHADPKDVEIDKFAREVAHLLEEGRVTNKYHEIIIFAEPHFYGLLNKHVSKQVKELFKKVIQKDYIHLNEPEIRNAINGE